MKGNKRNIAVTPFYFDYVLNKDYPVIICIGGRYSGKTQFVGQQIIMNAYDKKDYKVLIVEDVETNINEGVKVNVEERIDEFGHTPIYQINKAPPKITNTINGNEIIFRGYHTEKQQKRAKSLNEITAIWYEEAENITYEQFKQLRMLLRGGEPKDRQLFLTLNPTQPDGFINQYFFVENKPDKVLVRFDDGRPKVFIKNIEVELGAEKAILPCLIVLSTHWDNIYLTDEQRADVEEYKNSDPDQYAMYAEAKFVKPRGALIKKFNIFSMSKLDLRQAGKLTAVVDTASSGKDSATLGIYAKYSDNKHYLVAAYKDDRDANIVIPQMNAIINKFKPQTVWVENNHEGLYFKNQIDINTPSSIFVKGFFSSENKHDKILSQSGRMREHLYVRDDGNDNYNDFIMEAGTYNKEQKLNKADDCIDNIAMYFKHADGQGKWMTL